jgi:hypothetical protein
MLVVRLKGKVLPQEYQQNEDDKVQDYKQDLEHNFFQLTAALMVARAPAPVPAMPERWLNRLWHKHTPGIGGLRLFGDRRSWHWNYHGSFTSVRI